MCSDSLSQECVFLWGLMRERNCASGSDRWSLCWENQHRPAPKHNWCWFCCFFSSRADGGNNLQLMTETFCWRKKILHFVSFTEHQRLKWTVVCVCVCVRACVCVCVCNHSCQSNVNGVEAAAGWEWSFHQAQCYWSCWSFMRESVRRQTETDQ